MSITPATLKTIVGIQITPFTTSGDVDHDALRRNVDFLVENGIDIIVPCGNTGEFYSLTPEECSEIVTTVCAHAPDDTFTVAGIGRAPGTAAELAAHAEQQGADAVMVHYPPHPFLTDAGFLGYVDRIMEESDLPLLPYIKGPEVSDDTVLELVDRDAVPGVKYAINELQRFASVVSQAERQGIDTTWICGTAESWATFFWNAGAEGFTSGLVNVAPEYSREFLNVLRGGDPVEIRKTWAKIRPFEELRARNNSEYNVSAVKEAMHQLGLGSRRVRPPISELPEQERKEIHEILTDWDLL